MNFGMDTVQPITHGRREMDPHLKGGPLKVLEAISCLELVRVDRPE